MDRDKAFTHSLSQRCTQTSIEKMTPNTTPTSTETPSNVRSQRWSKTSRDSSVLYRDTIGMCLKFMHMQNFEYACIFIFFKALFIDFAKFC